MTSTAPSALSRSNTDSISDRIRSRILSGSIGKVEPGMARSVASVGATSGDMSASVWLAHSTSRAMRMGASSEGAMPAMRSTMRRTG